MTAAKLSGWVRRAEGGDELIKGVQALERVSADQHPRSAAVHRERHAELHKPTACFILSSVSGKSQVRRRREYHRDGLQ